MPIGDGITRLLAATLLATGCGRYAFDPLVGVDGQGTTADAPCTVVGPWSNITNIASVSSPAHDFGPSLHPNGLDLVFHSLRSGSAELYFASRPAIDQPFSAATMILTSGDEQSQADWSEDGTKLYYRTLSSGGLVRPYLGSGTFGTASTSEIPQAHGLAFTDDTLEAFYTELVSPDYDLSYASRATTGSSWQIGNLLTSYNRVGLSEGFPSFDDPRQTLYIAYELVGTTSIQVTTRTGRGMPFAPLQQLTDLGADDADDPSVSSDGRTLMFASSRPGGVGNMDIYIATRSCI